MVPLQSDNHNVMLMHLLHNHKDLIMLAVEGPRCILHLFVTFKFSRMHLENTEVVTQIMPNHKDFLLLGYLNKTLFGLTLHTYMLILKIWVLWNCYILKDSLWFNSSVFYFAFYRLLITTAMRPWGIFQGLWICR